MMASAQRGDARAYARLLEELGGVIERFLRSQFGNLEFVEDCVQECLLAIHGARHTFTPGRRFRPWLFAIVRHKAIDEFRRQRSRAQAMRTLTADTGSQPVEDTGIGGALLERLDRSKSEALVMTKVIGLTNAEAAERCGISESAMKLRVFRALREARQLLEQEGWHE